MKKIAIYFTVVLIITIFLPTVIVRTFNFGPVTNTAEGQSLDRRDVIKPIEGDPQVVEEIKLERIKVYNNVSKKAESLLLDDYVKGVVAAEMPAAFHIEALKAQAIAARTYAISRSIKFENGHPDHPSAPLCSKEHCQAYLSLADLQTIHGDTWVEDYWGKIEEAVDSTVGIIIYYEGEIVEPLYHSTSGGMTEDAVHVFAVDSPYLKAVESPYEEASPRFRSIVNLTVDEFIDKLKSKYPSININKENFYEKIKLLEKTDSGRVKTLAIDDLVINGRDIRDLYGLDSTNFKIMYDKNLKLIEIETYGFGHGVGMSQWGANGMAKQGKSYQEILRHYYSGIELKRM